VLVVRALAPPQLLAMKLSAWRDDLDIEDARLLLSKIEGDRERVWEQVEPYLVPGRELKSEYAFEDLWESEHADPSTD
jgi:predicted nucleotidyltransferase